MRALVSIALLVACGSAPTPNVSVEPIPAHPCELAEGVLHVPVPRAHALAAGNGACLLIDERAENTFLSIGRLGAESAGFGELQANGARTYLRENGVLGQDVRFTGRGTLTFAEHEAEVQRFVATPPGLPERAGVAAFVMLHDAALVVLSLADDAERADALLRTAARARFEPILR